MHPFFSQEQKPLLLGVCMQLSKYLSLDVRIIRLLFILLAIPFGASIIIYIALGFLFRALDVNTLPNSVHFQVKRFFNQMNDLFRYGISYNKVESREKQIIRLICLFAGIYLLILGLRLFLTINSGLLLNFLFLLIALSLFFKRRIDVGMILFFLALLIFLELLFGWL